MPRPIRKKPQPIDSILFTQDNELYQANVWLNPADEGGRGAHMLRKRWKAYDEALNYCEHMLNSPSDIQRKSFTKHVNGETTIKRFGEIIVQIVKPLKISKTLSEEIVQMVRIHFKATGPYRNQPSIKK